MIRRREFLAQTSAAATLLACPAIVRGQNLNSRLQVAGIGCDGKGWSDIKEMSDHAQTQMVGFCDIDLARTEKVKQLAPDAPVFQNFKDLLADQGDKIDAVTVSTPDHMHAYITLDALAQGKHVYCQKPLTHNVAESRAVAKAAKESGKITRLGNQIHSHTFYRSAVAAIQAGLIGKVKRVHSWSSATGHGKSGHISVPKNPPPLPTSVNWDLWVGVAPMRDYGGDRVYHPWGWRDWQDFGNGALGDFGCHIFDPVFTAIEMNKAPLSMKADHSGMNDQVWPAQTRVEYQFPGTKWTAADTLEVTWYDGGLLPSVSGSHVPPTDALPSQGSLIIGDKGTMVLKHMGRAKLYPLDQYATDAFDDLPSLNHYHGWVDGCLSGQQPSDGFDYGAKLTESVLLGNIAVRYANKKLLWDEPAMKITNHNEANQWLRRDYRAGWKLDV
ncbi:Gfo/Idh/MocA family protein [Planctomycetes bacterium K23_9]|uniref:Glucose--fructose oxidoreductase n=1 Tax=Stieleria marina TaxID=1930275 RepID=A0A517NVL9_9BACT|nr:Glucose--fructose oxidoreductase precursor [Planctomycetes bacterium K23_9]